MYHLCETYRKLPDDPEIQDMDPILRTWLYFGWLEKKEEERQNQKHLGCLIGSFWNPKAARELLGEGGQTFESDDKDFEEAWNIVKKARGKKKPRKSRNR